MQTQAAKPEEAVEWEVAADGEQNEHAEGSDVEWEEA